MDDPEELQAALKQFNDAYAATLPKKLKQLHLTWSHFAHAEWNQEEFQRLHRLVHDLTGSGKTFGFSALSDAARQLEQYLKTLGAAQQRLNEPQREQITSLLAALDQAALQPDKAYVAPPPLSSITPHEKTTTDISHRVFVVEDDRHLAEELKAQLNYFKYDVHVFHTLNDFRSAMQHNPTGVVLMDITFPEDSLGGIHVMADLQRDRAVPLPVIFISSHNELAIRLGAVRSGGVAYLSKPLDIGMLIDKLDELTSTSTTTAFRVLIVDDDISLSSYHALVLERAGMSVKMVNDPLAVMQPLLDFAPDLILIDMYMPACSGMELATVIRQMDAFVSIPIVFLSAETNLDKQLVALGLGGDDFLSKPIEPHQLVSSIKSRITRSMVLRSFMVRDSLTGLLNHTAVKDQLTREIAQAKRRNRPLSFAMVDIDHFKNVNDSYGHPAGDRVIKSLSRLLKQRLRETDLIGRYGGEEFAVVLVDTDGPAAVNVLDAIRADFAKLRHLTEGKEFAVSFSCGIATIAHFDQASKLTDAADKALYAAKHAGRNRIVLAEAQSI